MTYKHFIQTLLAYKKFWEDISNLYDLGFDLMEGKYNLTHPVGLMIEASIESHYGKDGWDWVSWFIHESEYGQRDWSQSDTYKTNEDGTSELVYKEGEVRFGAHDENRNPICYSFESLWDYLEKQHKQKED
jgi:hypothetical protein